MKVYIDRLPQPGDIVVIVDWDSGDFYLSFEPRRRLYAKNLIANPYILLGFVFRMWWWDFKNMLRGHLPRPTETIRDFEERE